MIGSFSATVETSISYCIMTKFVIMGLCSDFTFYYGICIPSHLSEFEFY